MLHTIRSLAVGAQVAMIHSLLQNSSMISADRRPQRYRPEKRRSSPTQDLNPSMAGEMMGLKSAFLQFRITATSVRPACANWWIT